MARICCIFRSRVWLYSLLCVLSVVAKSEAATRVPVKMPTNETALSKGVATKGTGVVHVDVSEGEYIPGHTVDKRVPVKVIKRIDYSIPRTITQAKSLLKANLAQALLTVTIGAAVSAVGWLIDEGSQSPTKGELVKPVPGEPAPLDQYNWRGSGSGTSATGTSALEVMEKLAPQLCYEPWRGCQVVLYNRDSPTTASAYVRRHYQNDTANSQEWPIYASTNSVCPPGYSVHADGSCTSDEVQFAPVSDSDFSEFDSYISAQTADWIKSLVRDGCAGAMNVEACTQDLQDFHNVTGPASVPGPSTTTTGTYTRPDGTTGTTSSVTTTNYSLLYGDNYFDYSKSTTITNTKDGVTTDQSTTADDPAVTEETPPEDEKEEEKPSPCTTNCDGPAYVDMYDKTDKTKEGELDSYKSKIQSIPIIAAVSGLFNVSVSAACPVWSYSGQLEIMGHVMPIDLVFDFHCQPWFTDLRPYVQAIMLLICGLLAVRIGLL